MWRVVDFAPFIGFGFALRYGASEAHQFYVGAGLAMLSALASTIWGRRVNPLISAVFVWFLFAALAHLTRVAPLVAVLDFLGESSLFLFVVAVGLYETLFSPRGFVDRLHEDPGDVRRTSFYLLGIAFGAFGLAFWLRGSMPLGGILPYALLFLAQAWLRRQLARPVAA